MIDDNNVLAKSFRRVKDFVNSSVHLDFGLRLFRHRLKDPRVYNTPITDEITALIVGDMSNLDVGRDIIVKKYSGQLFRLHETHTAFIPLQYHLIFITITYNVNWSEIREFVTSRGLTVVDRPDIVCKLFKMKLDQMMLTSKKMNILAKLMQVMTLIHILKFH